MVNQDNIQLLQKVLELQQQVVALNTLIHQHLGIQQGAIASNLPHPAMSAASRGAYSITSTQLASRTVNADTATTLQLAWVVATLLTDLQTANILR